MAVKILKLLPKIIKVLGLAKKIIDIIKSPKAEDYLGRKDK